MDAVVTGRVQGVGFRRYVQRWARKLDLGGWVRNEADGTVRLHAVGDAEAIDRLSRLLWGGPPGARVDAVEIDRAVGDSSVGDGEGASGFEVRR